MTEEQEQDVALIQAAMPALLRMSQSVNRLAYLEETNAYKAVVGRVYQTVVNDWASTYRSNPDWQKPEADPYARTRVDQLWRLTELLRAIYPDAVAAIGG